MRSQKEHFSGPQRPIANWNFSERIFFSHFGVCFHPQPLNEATGEEAMGTGETLAFEGLKAERAQRVAVCVVGLMSCLLASGSGERNFNIAF